MRGCELKRAALAGRGLYGAHHYNPQEQTDAGERVIPLNSDVWGVVLSLRAKAQNLFGAE